MMRTQTLTACAVGALAAAALAFAAPAQGPIPGQGEPKLVALEKRVEALEKQLETMTAFAEAQADAGEELLDALARSEAEGFTAGINPKSREILLAGLRAQAKAMKGGADGKSAAPKAPTRGDRGRRQER